MSLFLRLDLTGDAKGAVPAWRRFFSTLRVLRREQIEPLFVEMEEIAQTHNKTIAQMALNWLLTKDERIIPIPGAKTARQVAENVEALGWRLPAEEHARISQTEVLTR